MIGFALLVPVLLGVFLLAMAQIEVKVLGVCSSESRDDRAVAEEPFPVAPGHSQ